MIRLICFDMDDTLMDFHKGEKIAFYEAMKKMNQPCDEEIYACYSDINEKLWKALEQKKVTKSELRILRFQQLKDKLQLDYDVQKLNEFFVDSLSKQCFLFESSEEVVAQCSSVCELAVATNGIASVQRGRLKCSNIASYFTYYFISEEMGCDKPHLEYFKQIFEKVNVQPNEVLFVGDSLSADIKGAVLSGCVSVWYNPKHLVNHTEVVPDYEIDDLKKVVEIWEARK